VLKWTADGKSASEIADLLTLSKNTVDFPHQKCRAQAQDRQQDRCGSARSHARLTVLTPLPMAAT
jgi:transposase